MSEIRIKLPKLEKELEKEIVKGMKILVRAEVARALLLKKWDKLLAKSKLTDKECIALGRKFKKGRFKKLKEIGLI